MNTIVNNMHKAYKKLLENSATFEKRISDIENLISKDISKNSEMKSQEKMSDDKNKNRNSQYKLLEEMIFSNKENLNKIEKDLENLEKLKPKSSKQSSYGNENSEYKV